MKNKELTFKAEQGIFDSGTTNLINGNITSLCFEGVRRAFPGIPDDVKTVTFVFSTRPLSEAVKLSYSISESDYKWLTEDDKGWLCDDDYDLHLDDEGINLMFAADAKMRRLWEQGYNYMRAEYVV